MELKENCIYSVFTSKVGNSIYCGVDFSKFFRVLYKGNGKFKFLGVYNTENDLHRLRKDLILACDNWLYKIVALNDNVLKQINCNYAAYPIFDDLPKELNCNYAAYPIFDDLPKELNCNLVNLLYRDIFYRHKTIVD